MPESAKGRRRHRGCPRSRAPSREGASATGRGSHPPPGRADTHRRSTVPRHRAAATALRRSRRAPSRTWERRPPRPTGTRAGQWPGSGPALLLPEVRPHPIPRPGMNLPTRRTPGDGCRRTDRRALGVGRGRRPTPTTRRARPSRVPGAGGEGSAHQLRAASAHPGRRGPRRPFHPIVGKPRKGYQPAKQSLTHHVMNSLDDVPLSAPANRAGRPATPPANVCSSFTELPLAAQLPDCHTPSMYGGR